MPRAVGAGTERKAFANCSPGFKRPPKRRGAAARCCAGEPCPRSSPRFFLPLRSGDSAAGLGACGSLPAAHTHIITRHTRTAKPPAPREGPPRPEQVAPGMGAGTIPASSSQGSWAPSGAGENPPPRAPGCSGYPRSPPARSTRPELPLPVRLPAAAAGGSDGGDRAASIPQGWGGGSGSEGGAATLCAPGHGASQKPSFSSAGVKGFPQTPLVLSVDVSAG